MSAKNAFRNIFLPPLWTNETVMCALTECTWYLEDLAFCLFNISELLKRFNFSWYPINICLLHSHFCSSVVFFLLVITALSQNLSVHNGGKSVLSLVKRIYGFRGNALLVFYLFVWASCKWKNSIILSIIFPYFKCLVKAMCCFQKRF